MKLLTYQYFYIFVFATSFITIALSITLFHFGFSALTNLLSTEFYLAPSSFLFKTWLHIPPLTTSIYIFNVTNVDDVLEGKRKPNVTEIGPFVFDEIHEKTKVSLNWNNFTITYQQVRKWHFRECNLQDGIVRSDETFCLNDTVVTVINAPAAYLNALVSRVNGAVWRETINLGIKVMDEKLFVSKSVNELLFDGYSDPILSDTKFIPDSLMPGKMDKFGFFYGRNNSDWFDGVFNMAMGFSNDTDETSDGPSHQQMKSDMGQILRWNYSDHVPFYPDECGEVRGAGDMFAPFNPYLSSIESGISPNITIFTNDLCRPLILNHDITKRKTLRGLPIYEISSSLFSNASTYPQNSCFNPESDIKFGLPNGVFNASRCRFGAPVYISQPHFFQADPYYKQQLYMEQGNTVEEEAVKHQSSVAMDPNTGIATDVCVRMQVNFRLLNVPNIDLYEKLPNQPLYMPAVWFETKFGLHGSQLTMSLILINLSNILVGGGWLFAVITASLLFCLGVVFWHRKRGGGASPADSIPLRVDGDVVARSHSMSSRSSTEITGLSSTTSGSVSKVRRSGENQPILNQSLYEESNIDDEEVAASSQAVRSDIKV